MTRMREELIMRLLFDDTSTRGDDCLAKSKTIFDELALNSMSLLSTSPMRTRSIKRAKHPLTLLCNSDLTR